ncbi:MAG: endonuclease/exonuclease/phosphatase family protein [Kiloniellales bacterium]|nr:endonuclease/exonuclease/phosphatase family protein [Kiloniellales bacterium]
MRLASFNLENLDDDPGRDPPFESRVAALRPQLQRLDADVLCLQEVDAQRDHKGRPRRLRALDRLLEGTAYAGFHRACSLRRESGEPADKHNLVILSRWPILASRQLHHDLVPPVSYRPVTAEPAASDAAPILWDRPILQASLGLPDRRRLEVVNLHLRAPLAAPIAGQKLGAFAWRSVPAWAEGFYLASLKRCGQALEARRLVDQLFDSDPEALIAVCGDFNAEAQETPLRIVRGDLEDTGNGALAGRSLVPLERALPDSQRFSVLHQGRRLMLDHMLVSRALLAFHRAIEVHNEALGDELVAYATGSHSPESFHAPLVAAFRLPGA